jgi:phage host-nuclease inhibitor protein Gam
VREAVALTEDEIVQLKKTISALREQAERFGASTEDAVGAVHSHYRGDLQQLQATIRELREQLQGAPVSAGD